MRPAPNIRPPARPEWPIGRRDGRLAFGLEAIGVDLADQTLSANQQALIHHPTPPAEVVELKSLSAQFAEIEALNTSSKENRSAR